MNNFKPLFSCVTPTNGRVDHIRNLLASLRSAVTIDGRPLEIIIIDDSPSNEAVEIQKLCEQSNAKYIKGVSSVREKRNLGIEAASGEYVFFIDSDCTADSMLFVRHHEVLSNGGYDACIGITEFVGDDTPLWSVISLTKFLDSFKFPAILKGKVCSAPWGPTTNLSVKRDILLNLGGFETKFPFNLGADDADLGMRINSSGHRIGMSEKALVYHSRKTWNGWRKILKRVFRWGRMDYYLYYCRHQDQTAFTMPKPISYYFLTLPLQIAASILISWYLSLALILAPVVYLIIFAFIRKRHWKMKGTSIFTIAGAEMINQCFDLGCIIMSLKHGSIQCLWREAIDDPRELWHTKIHNTWAAILTIIIVLAIDILTLIFV